MLNALSDPPSLLTHGADYTIAHSLAAGADGAELWRLGGLNPPGENYHTTLRFVASPGVGTGPDGDALIVVPTAKRGPVFAVERRSRLGGSRHWPRRSGPAAVP